MIGSFALVLHSHLPWLPRHGTWPVGEEWLYQAWASSYLPVVDVLSRLAAEGRRDLVTLGVTPVLAAQLDDEYCLINAHAWLGNWRSRAEELAVSGSDPDTASRECAEAARRLDQFEAWRSGGSPVLRGLADTGAIELLGGPATHAFGPLLGRDVLEFGLGAGLDDAALRFGSRRGGIWAPECGYRPGMEESYQALDVTHVMVDGPTLQHVGAHTGSGWTVGGSDVVVFGRDLSVSYRVWSPKRGYPGDPWYRDFYSYVDGFRPHRVTSKHSPDKAPYDPAPAQATALRDAEDFVRVVRERLLELRDEHGRESLVVAAYDTELFGHWWYEGPQWLEHVLRLLPEAGVELTTLDAARERHVAGAVELESGSWGSGKDWRVWQGPAVEDMVADNEALQSRWRDVVKQHVARDPLRSRALDALANEALLALSSDWAFMVTKDSAAEYARRRHREHHAEFHRLADLIERGREVEVGTGELVFGHVDGRGLVR